MRNLIFIYFVLICFFSSGQSWQVIPASHFGVSTIWGGNEWRYRYFEINPYDNSLWLIRYDRMMQIEDNGTFTFFADTIDPNLPSNAYYRDFGFFTGKVFVTDEFSGLYSFDGSNWSTVYNSTGGVHLSEDADTIWWSRSNNVSVKLYNGTPNFLSTLGSFQIEARNGIVWSNSSPYGYGSLIKHYDQQSGVGVYYSSDTSALLSNVINDFKFSPNSDSLYVASDLGISIAYGDQFVDTITINNTVNMPDIGVIEIEFDPSDNIYALFGNALNSPDKIGYLDRTTNTWIIYDQSNSPIDFSYISSIEVDTSGNLWVASKYNLYVLKQNNWPQWLGNKELEFSELNVYPNPSKDVLHVDGLKNLVNGSVRILDLRGQLVDEVMLEGNSIGVSHLESGVYLLEVQGSVVRFVKE